MMASLPDADGWYGLETDIPVDAIERLSQIDLVEKLSVRKIPLVTVKLAKRLATLKVGELFLWCDITRRAMRYLIELPELRVLDVLAICGPGQLANFGKAQQLEVFRANHYMTERDLLEVTQCASLRDIGAQNATLSAAVISAMLALPRLGTLDLGASNFDDRMARHISRSATIESLHLGGTRISRAGLEHLAAMKQLRSLDLWATALKEVDLKLLSNLADLEYLSLGNYDHLPSMDAEAITALLLDLPSLKRVWLDGIRLEPSQKDALESRLDSLVLSNATQGCA